MNLNKRGSILLLVVSLTATQVQAGTADSMITTASQVCSDKVAELVENGHLIPVLCLTAMTALWANWTYSSYKAHNHQDRFDIYPSIRFITGPAIPFFGLGTIAFGAATIKLICDA